MSRKWLQIHTERSRITKKTACIRRSKISFLESISLHFFLSSGTVFEVTSYATKIFYFLISFTEIAQRNPKLPHQGGNFVIVFVIPITTPLPNITRHVIDGVFT